jgi:heat shock protein HslJ
MAVGILAASLLLAACSSGSGSTAATGGTGGTIEGIDWALTSYLEGKSLNATPVGVFADARFEAGKVSGVASCNSFNGAANISGATLAITDVTSSPMPCPIPASQVEASYLVALQDAASFTATADALTIFDASGTTILTYAVVAAGIPTGVTWNLVAYNNGQQEIVRTTPGSNPTAVFGTDGTVSGNASCNTYNGPYTIDGDKITIGPLISTQMACASEDQNRQEAAFLAALQNATTFGVQGKTLAMRNDVGVLQVDFAQQ